MHRARPDKTSGETASRGLWLLRGRSARPLRILHGAELVDALGHDLFVVIVPTPNARLLGDRELLVDDLLERFLGDAAADELAVDEEPRRAVDVELRELRSIRVD